MPARKPSSPTRTRPVAARRRSLPAALARGTGTALLVGAAGACSLVLAGSRALAARPVLFAGLAAFLGTSALVATNALVWQGSVHPQPMLATRIVEASVLTTGGTQEAATPGPQPWRPTNDPRIMTVPLVREAQVLLTEAGYYEAEIDGRPGQATDRAIRTFQAERGLRVDGMATPLLLTQIRQLTAETPRPSNRPDGRQYAGLDELMSDIQSDGVDIPILDEEPADPQLVRAIQARLAEAQVAELTADGIMGSKTRAAIRSFQELDGLTVTGEPTPALLARLEAVASDR